MSVLIDMMEQGILPDKVIRRGIRRLLKNRLLDEYHGDTEVERQRQHEFFALLRQSPLAVATGHGKDQHSDLSHDFFSQVLGPRLKYSSCLYPIGVTGIAAAEEAMLAQTCRRAGIADGMDILELGCGWGSLTLWIAEHYPEACITTVSNSVSQCEFIESVCSEKGFCNVRIVNANMNNFVIDDTFDRIVSVEMFERMRNYAELLRRISGWLKADGRLFVHLFCHRELAYFFETELEDNDRMASYFFAGGIMPSDHLLFYFNDHLLVEDHWRVNGRHYQHTSEDWLKLLDTRREKILPILRAKFGDESEIWLQRWRMFFMVYAELFGYNSGNEWFVGHYLLRKAKYFL